MTPNAKGSLMLRIRCTICSPWVENGSTSGTTDSHVPRPPSDGVNRSERTLPTIAAGTMYRVASTFSTPGSDGSTAASFSSGTTP